MISTDHRPPRELAESPDIIVATARGARGRARVLREVRGRYWASSLGVRTPAVVAYQRDGMWLASARSPDGPGAGAPYLRGALASLERIGGAHLPWSEPGPGWRSPALTRPLRALMLTTAGINLRTFVQTRNQAQQLAPDVVVHGDFHRANVLDTTDHTGEVSIIDWEHLSYGPRHHDAIRLIATLGTDAAMQTGWEDLLRSAPVAQWRSIALQVRWIALRTLAGEASEIWPERDPEQIARFRRRYALAAHWARDLEQARGTAC